MILFLAVIKEYLNIILYYDIFCCEKTYRYKFCISSKYMRSKYFHVFEKY